jgi:sulfite reductase alpha subunit-like flavoprotein
MEQEVHVWELMANHGAHIYVSGSAQKMPSDVLTAFEGIVMRMGGKSMEEAKQYLRLLELKGRYHVEAWS